MVASNLAIDGNVKIPIKYGWFKMSIDFGIVCLMVMVMVQAMDCENPIVDSYPLAN